MMNRTLQKNLFRWSFALIAFTIALGALGAHALKELITANALGVYQTAIQYQFIHAFALLLLALGMRRLNEEATIWAVRFFIGGLVLFCGSLYILSTKELTLLDSEIKWVGPLTPIGGLSFIAGWLWLAAKGYKTSESENGPSRHHSTKNNS
jgi:uncharacterized membrane protein YgdD (TMEM256/DUF423 family)